MKYFKLLITAAACMLLMAGASFAQVAFTTTSTTDLIAPNAQTGSVGNILLTALGPGNAGGPVLGADTLTIAYSGAQLSVLSGIAVTVDVDGVAGGEIYFGAAGPAPVPFTQYGAVGAQTNTNVRVTVNTTNISISFLAAAPTAFLAQGYIRVIGVKLNVSDVASVGGSINATMYSIAGQLTVTNPNVPVASVRDPMNYYAEDDARLPAKMSTAGVGIDYAPTSSTRASMYVRFRETSDFTDAFETMGVNAATQLIYTISGIPDGIVVDTSSGYAPVVYDASGTVTAAVSSTAQSAGTATIKVDITAQDALTREWIGLKVVFKSTATTIAAGTATINVTLGPAATSSQLDQIATGSGGLLVNASNPLKYKALAEPDLNALTVAPVKTYLMSTWNVYIPPVAAGGAGFSTGYAVSNTSGILEVGKQTDVIKVWFFPWDGSEAKTFTTGASHMPGIGLNADGKLPPGATWAVLISDLLPEAGITGSFQGMVIFECNFTNAHGVNFIADGLFESNSQGYQMLVLPSSRNKTSEQLTH